MKRLIFVTLLFALMALLTACSPAAATTLPPHIEKVWPEIKYCMSQQQDVEWDGKFNIEKGNTTSMSQFRFDSQSRKAVITRVDIGGNLSNEKQAVALKKGSCYLAVALEAAVKSCVKSWDPVTICQPEDTFTGSVDAFAVSYMTADEQALFFPADLPKLQLPPGTLDFSCDTLKIFEQWSRRGLIAKGNWAPLLEAKKCNK